jgi:hypothetical protein
MSGTVFEAASATIMTWKKDLSINCQATHDISPFL